MVDRRGRYQREMCGSRLGLGLVGGLLIGALAAPADAQPATRPYAPAARPDGAAPVALRATVVTPATARTAQSAAVVRFHGVPPQALAVRATGTSAAAVTAVADGSEVPVAIGEQVIVERKPLASDRPEAPLVIRDSAKQSLPAMILVGVQNPRTGKPTAAQLQPFVQAEMVPLRWDPAANGYVTTLVAGIDRVDGDLDADVELIEPVTLQTRRLAIDVIDPDRLTVTTIGAAGYTKATIIARHWVEEVGIDVHSSVGDRSLRAPVDPGLALELVASDEAVPAFGLGSTTVTVQRQCADGSPLPAGSELRIPATTSRGRLEPTEFAMKPGENTARVTLYSASIGPARITLHGVSAAARDLEVRLVWPWFLFGAGLLGALAGAALRALMSPRDRTSAMLIGSIVTGVVVDILLSLGVPLVKTVAPHVMTAEAGWFVFGLLAGLLGTPFLVQLAHSVFGAKEASPGHGEAAPGS